MIAMQFIVYLVLVAAAFVLLVYLFAAAALMKRMCLEIMLDRAAMALLRKKADAGAQPKENDPLLV